MHPDLIVLAASNGENLKLAERCVNAAHQRQAQAELIDLTSLSLPLYTPGPRPLGQEQISSACEIACTQPPAG